MEEKRKWQLIELRAMVHDCLARGIGETQAIVDLPDVSHVLKKLYPEEKAAHEHYKTLIRKAVQSINRKDNTRAYISVMQSSLFDKTPLLDGEEDAEPNPQARTYVSVDVIKRKREARLDMLNESEKRVTGTIKRLPLLADGLKMDLLNYVSEWFTQVRKKKAA